MSNLSVISRASCLLAAPTPLRSKRDKHTKSILLRGLALSSSNLLIVSSVLSVLFLPISSAFLCFFMLLPSLLPFSSALFCSSFFLYPKRFQLPSVVTRQNVNEIFRIRNICWLHQRNTNGELLLQPTLEKERSQHGNPSKKQPRSVP